MWNIELDRLGNLYYNQLDYLEKTGPNPIVLPIVVPVEPKIEAEPVETAIVLPPTPPIQRPVKKRNTWLYVAVPVALYIALK